MNSFQLQIDDLTVEVTRKKIKNVHLRVYPPAGTVRMSMPVRMRVSDARRFLLSREEWIRHHQQQIRQRPMAKEIDLVDGEEHFFRGHGYALRVVEKPAPPAVAHMGGELLLQVRPDADRAKRVAVLDRWYRQQMQQSLAELVEPWQRRMGVTVTAMKVRKMKTRWGSCTPRTGAIRMNLELIKRPPDCLEYVLVHELAHLLEPSHNRRFQAIMDEFLPDWRERKHVLNAGQSGQPDWQY